MRQKIHQTALEHDYNLSRLNFPEFLREEAKRFIFRNKLTEIHVCPQCMKAHLMKKAKEFGFNKEIGQIEKSIKCPTGHEGYYLDQANLIKINL